MRPVDDPGRLAQALANWDIQTHRTLARVLEPANILLITRAQGLIAGASMVLADAAAAAGALERSDRLVPAIAEAGRSWSNLASRWGDLVPPGARIEEPLGSRGRGGPRRLSPDHPRPDHAGQPRGHRRPPGATASRARHAARDRGRLRTRRGRRREGRRP
ncbi:hypothetical protein G5V59_19280 [Nocardioides sp. W3-2-3]|uniref:hypothetical protein n=1 Tax=Nocardioides convexus TaxID=2712224 RepID=UPI00241826F7|nr:hypothetical protein [Nocardioides convexus]NHA01272.1 hypothetical protein [Nocardioides convexus]